MASALGAKGSAGRQFTARDNWRIPPFMGLAHVLTRKANAVSNGTVTGWCRARWRYARSGALPKLSARAFSPNEA